MKYLKSSDKLSMLFTPVLDSKSAQLFKSFDKNRVLTTDGKYALIKDGDLADLTLTKVGDDLVEIEDTVDAYTLGLIASLGRKKIFDDFFPDLSQGIVNGQEQLKLAQAESFPSAGPFPSLESPEFSNYIEALKAQGYFLVKLYPNIDDVLDRQSQFATVNKAVFDDASSPVYITTSSKTNLVSFSEDLILDSLNYHIKLFKHLKKEFKDNISSRVAVLDCYSKILDARDRLEILDESYAKLESTTGNSIGKKFGKDEVDKVEEYLKNHPEEKILKSDDDGVVVGSEELDEEKLNEVKEIGDSEYSLSKVNQSKYTVDKDGEPAYTLEKRGTTWKCSCTGFKYRGHCKHIDMLNDKLPTRHPMHEIDAFYPEIQSIFEGFDRWEVVGSYRRRAKTFKDIDVLVECDSSDFSIVLDRLSSDPSFEKIMSGNDIIRGYYHGYMFDVTRVEPGEWATYLLYRTGSADFNIRMRKALKSRGWRLNEHGLFNSEGEKIQTSSEEDIFKAAGYAYVRPEFRN